MLDIPWEAKSPPFENLLVYREDITHKEKISISVIFRNKIPCLKEVSWRLREWKLLIAFKNNPRELFLENS